MGLKLTNRITADLKVIVPNLNWRYSGVTATNRMIVPLLAKRLNVAWLGFYAPDGVARMTWRERGIHASLTFALPAAVQTQLEGELLSDAAQEAGCTRHNLSFELCERAVVAAGPELAEQLRARGWGVVLRGDPRCPLPFGTRARSLYTELVLEAPETPDPFLALEDGDRSPPACSGPGSRWR